ncbi:MAG TPA: hypothetical protein VGY91_14215 [Chthoniobacterales bacterium]|jgi:hypothetical protein|nr:hypothetical protein [Chthoniobacterales bacterium]
MTLLTSRFRNPSTSLRLLPLVIAVFAASPLLSEQTATDGEAGSAASPRRAVHAKGTQPGPTAAPRASLNPELGRLAKVADKVLDQIQTEENDLYLRLNYFEKPERLDPSSFASKDEVAQWQGVLQQLKEKNDKVSGLYANFSKDLDAALKSAGANEEVAARFKQLILDGFPWDRIQRKKELISDFIEAHGKLLIFYEKNWGSWLKGSDPGKPEFTSASAASIYKRLRDKIVSTSDQIQKEYKAMSE